MANESVKKTIRKLRKLIRPMAGFAKRIRISRRATPRIKNTTIDSCTARKDGG